MMLSKEKQKKEWVQKIEMDLRKESYLSFAVITFSDFLNSRVRISVLLGDTDIWGPCICSGIEILVYT